MSDIAYCIEVPYISSGLKRTYKKKLEVFSGPREGNFIKCNTLHYLKRGEWATKTAPSCTRFVGVIIHNSIPNFNIISNESLVFSSLELAQAAKILLIQRLAESYQKELKRLQELFSKNVPNIEKVALALKEDNPEYFL